MRVRGSGSRAGLAGCARDVGSRSLAQLAGRRRTAQYYGQHYFAYWRQGGPQRVGGEPQDNWVCYNDASVWRLGNWQAVLDAHEQGRGLSGTRRGVCAEV